jgi:tRNA (guanosine-2'-O-)-methyltransferase
LVFGNEKYGISDEARSYSDGNFIIPQVGIIRSLNISVACAVSVYEAFRQKTLKNHYNTKKLTHEEEVILLKHWDEERFLE